MTSRPTENNDCIDENDLVLLIKNNANNATDTYYATSYTIDHKNQSFAVLRSGLECSNFVSGDVGYVDFQKILFAAEINDCESFYDLGCGSGNCLLAAALMGLKNGNDKCIKFSKVIGVELQYSKFIECQFLVSQIEQLCCNLTKLPSMEVINSNFFAIDWSDGNVVYACATCFSKLQMKQLIDKLLLLKKGSRVILLDKQITSANESENVDFLLANVVDKVITSWGSGVAYIYYKL